MKRLISVLWLGILWLCLTGCSEVQPFDFVLPIEIDPQFIIRNENGVWSEFETITYEDVADALDDLEDDIEFRDISIEGVSLIIDNQDPALSGVENVVLTLTDPQGQESVIYNNVSISIPPGQGRTTVVVTDLVQEGVLALKDLLEGYALADSFDDFVLVSSGSSTPQTTPLDMELTVILHLSFNYSQDLEVPYFLGNE